MIQKGKNSGLVSFALGAAVGAGLVLYQNARRRKHPDSLPDQRRINRALTRTLSQARLNSPIELAPDHRLVIFSDHHKGSGNEADDFRQCKETYLNALKHYDKNKYTLIILGDAEELWEEKIPDVMAVYPEIFELESRFFPGRYLRVVGNHDNLWEIQSNVQKFLDPYFPGIQIYQGLVIKFQDSIDTSGELFLTHGHQGTVDADILDFFPPLVLPYYRDFQNLTGFGHTSPSQDECLRGEHDSMMYRWARRQGKMLLIAGHTHRPVWSSRTHLEKLLLELTTLLQLKPDQRPANYEQELARLKEEVGEREQKSPPCNDIVKTRPCYFNTGCCRFEDGDITGIELEDSELRLIRWSGSGKKFSRTELEKASLVEIFSNL